jgi:hypothetical protein
MAGRRVFSFPEASLGAKNISSSQSTERKTKGQLETNSRIQNKNSKARTKYLTLRLNDTIETPQTIK